MAELVDSPIAELIESLDDYSGPLIYCRCCHNPITTHQEQTTIGHSNHYSFTNPAGITYHLRCFQQAPGCSLSGDPTEEFSWFAGYKWRFANCTECGEHLGWYYQYTRSLHNQRFFFGLIADRLIEKINGN